MKADLEFVQDWGSPIPLDAAISIIDHGGQWVEGRPSFDSVGKV